MPDSYQTARRIAVRNTRHYPLAAAAPLDFKILEIGDPGWPNRFDRILRQTLGRGQVVRCTQWPRHPMFLLAKINFHAPANLSFR